MFSAYLDSNARRLDYAISARNTETHICSSFVTREITNTYEFEIWNIKSWEGYLIKEPDVPGIISTEKCTHPMRG
jgi:hypothetical protein